jgi:hypothetical protein
LAAIDPDVGELLSSLLGTPVAFLAQAAIDSIMSEEPETEEGGRFSGDFEGYGADRHSRFGQLDLVNRIVSGRIKREIRMLERLRRLAPDLRLDSVSVLPVTSGEAAVGRATAQLLDPRRQQALHDFLASWNEVQSELRRRWEGPGAG